jgi:hypothetical protein
MNKTVKFLLSVSILSFAVCANAAVKKYENGKIPFSLDIPDGWTEQALDGGVMLIAPDKKSTFTIASVPADGLDSKTFAEGTAKEAKFKDPKIDCDEDGCSIIGTIQNVNVKTVISVDKPSDAVLVISMSGDNPEGFTKILDTLQ